MLTKYLIIFLVSMVPLIELRGAIFMAVGMELDYFTALAVCVIGNMLPVPIIYFFARKVLIWGQSRTGRPVCGPDAVCGHSSAGHRCLDGNPGCVVPEHGHQEYRPFRVFGRNYGGNYYGYRQHRCL